MRERILAGVVMLAASTASAPAQSPYASLPPVSPTMNAPQVPAEMLPNPSASYSPQSASVFGDPVGEMGGYPGTAVPPEGMPPGLSGLSPGAFDPPAVRDVPPPWVSVDFLNWWIQKKLPPLVTANNGTAGVLGQPGTVTLFGGPGSDDEEDHTGARATAVYFLHCLPVGLEARAMYLGERGTHFFAGSGQSGEGQVFSRPVFNTMTGQETAEIVSFIGQFSGNIHVDSNTMFWSGEANVLYQFDPECGYPVLIIGGRYLDLEEDLGIVQTSTALSGGEVAGGGAFFGPGTTASIGDHFTSRDQFIGGQLGLQSLWTGGNVSLKLRGTLAVGYTHESMTITGNTTITPPGSASFTLPGGLLALPTNIGHTSHDEIAMVPEGNVQVALHITNNIDFTIGYGILYWSDVARPTNIDRLVNPTQLPTSIRGTGLTGLSRPGVPGDTDLLTHGLDLGLALHY